jgi:hypothetical protein
MNPVHTLTPYFLKTHLNIILPCLSRYPKWSLPFRFCNKNFETISRLPHVYYMPTHFTHPDFITPIFGEKYKLYNSSLKDFPHPPLRVLGCCNLNNILNIKKR